ncbi:mitochondrial large ribosomal subunit l49 [Paramyrothecium foliicola]|nr:mitochondrial large ribosomal subunit l49 [Paramyrothecium foliicola]
MSRVFNHAASALRCTASRSSPLFSSAPLPTTQIASLSFQATRSVQQYRPSSKTPEEKRPKEHLPVPRPSKTPEELAQLPYVVRRTPSIQLPIYRKWMSGGTRQVIMIKKVEGDRRKMVEDLVGALQLTREDVRLNPTTQQIELKGDHFHKTKQWLLESGF